MTQPWVAEPQLLGDEPDAHMRSPPCRALQQRGPPRSHGGTVDAGLGGPHDYIYNFWSDQYEHTLRYVGHATTWDDFAVRGSLQEGSSVGFYLLAGVVQAAIGSTAEVIPNGIPIPSGRPAHAWWPAAPAPIAAHSPPGADLWSLTLGLGSPSVIR
jgi:hypothetical protein